jgi:hypothetical protein
MRNFLTIVFCLSLIGCAQAPIVIVKPFVDPQYGMTKLQLIDLVGTPDSIEIYKKNYTRVEYYIYARKYQSSQEKVPVCLIDNKVVGWGKTFYEDHVSFEDKRIK